MINFLYKKCQNAYMVFWEIHNSKPKRTAILQEEILFTVLWIYFIQAVGCILTLMSGEDGRWSFHVGPSGEIWSYKQFLECVAVAR